MPNSNLKHMTILSQIEIIAGRPLTPNDITLICNLSVEMPESEIIKLYTYCSKNNNIKPGYVKKVAQNWRSVTEESINESLNESAIELSKILASLDFSEYKVKTEELSLYTSWVNNGFNSSEIKSALKKTLDTINELSFPYAGKVLNTIRATPENNSSNNKNTDTDTSKNKFHNFKQRKYDFNELEQQIVNKWD